MTKEQYTYGIHVVLSALQNKPETIKLLMIDQSRTDKRLQEVRKTAVRQGCSIVESSKQALNKILPTINHQGVIAVLISDKAIPTSKEQFLSDLSQKDGNSFIIILDSITDSRNLGACLRTAAVSGADAVVIPKHRSAKLDSYAIKVASGAHALLPVITITNVANFLNAIMDIGLITISTQVHAETSIDAVDLTKPLALIFGSENSGVKLKISEKCNNRVSIPMARPAISYNVSVACGIACYEVQRQRLSMV